MSVNINDSSRTKQCEELLSEYLDHRKLQKYRKWRRSHANFHIDTHSITKVCENEDCYDDIQKAILDLARQLRLKFDELDDDPDFTQNPDRSLTNSSRTMDLTSTPKFKSDLKFLFN